MSTVPTPAVAVRNLTYTHIGCPVHTNVRTDEGLLHVEGRIRWFGMSASSVSVAIEESANGPVFEWDFSLNETLHIGSAIAGQVTR